MLYNGKRHACLIQMTCSVESVRMRLCLQLCCQLCLRLHQTSRAGRQVPFGAVLSIPLAVKPLAATAWSSDAAGTAIGLAEGAESGCCSSGFSACSSLEADDFEESECLLASAAAREFCFCFCFLFTDFAFEGILLLVAGCDVFCGLLAFVCWVGQEVTDTLDSDSDSVGPAS